MVKIGVMDKGARDKLQPTARNHLWDHLVNKFLIDAKHRVAEGLVPGGLVGDSRRAEKGRTVAVLDLDWTLPTQVHLELNPPGLGNQGKQVMPQGNVLRCAGGGEVFIVHHHHSVFPGAPVSCLGSLREDGAEPGSLARIDQEGGISVCHSSGKPYLDI